MVLQGSLSAGSTSRLNAPPVCQIALLFASHGALLSAAPVQEIRGRVVTKSRNGVLNLSSSRAMAEAKACSTGRIPLNNHAMAARACPGGLQARGQGLDADAARVPLGLKE